MVMPKKNIRLIILLSVIFIGIILIGIIGFMLIEDFSFIDALYTTVITFSTVGYEMPHHISDNGKIFTSVLIVITFGAFGYYVTIISRLFFEGIISNIYKKGRMKKRIEKLNNHVIICGYGRVGQQCAIDLFEHNESFMIIDIAEEVCQIIEEETKYPYLLGDATQEDVLIEAGIDRAKALITTMPNDANNVFVVLTARELNPDLKIISRASEERADKKLKRAGATNVIMPDRIGGQRMAKLVAQPDVVEFLEYVLLQSVDDVYVVEISCKNLQACFNGKSIGNLDIRNKSGANIIGLKTPEGQYLFNPRADYVLNKDDQLFVLGSNKQISALKGILEGKVVN